MGRLIDSGENRIQTIEAINTFCSIALTQTRMPLEISDAPTSTLLLDEINLIEATAHVTLGNYDKAHMCLQWYMEKNVRTQFIDTIQTLSNARCFKSYGQYSFLPNCFLVSEERGAKSVRHWSVQNTAELTISEQLVVNTSRLWVRGIALGFSSESATHCLANHLHLPGFADLIHNFLYQTATNAKREFDIRCLCCKEISPDEARLLATLSALHHGRPAEAVEHLNDWLPSNSIQRLLTQAANIRLSLAKLGNVLPLREWDFHELVQRQILFDHQLTTNGHASVH